MVGCLWVVPCYTFAVSLMLHSFVDCFALPAHCGAGGLRCQLWVMKTSFENAAIPIGGGTTGVFPVHLASVVGKAVLLDL